MRYGARILFRNPLFSFVAITSLALGIGGAASVFTVLNAVLLRNLPVPNPRQLFVVEKSAEAGRRGQYSWPAFEQARSAVGGRAELCAVIRVIGMQVRLGASPASAAERQNLQLVSGECFAVLRQQPQAGRLIASADNQTVGAHPVAVISDAFWTRHFDRSPTAIGARIIVNGASLTIIGVAAPEFFGPIVSFQNPDIWVPLMMQPAIRYASNASTSGAADPEMPWPPQADIEWLTLIARVPDAGQAAGIAASLTVQHQREAATRTVDDPEERERLARQQIWLEPAARGLSGLRTDLGTSLLVLLGMVFVLLSIACGNLASLLLSRANVRQREMAIRLAIGAGRGRVIRQLLAETLLLAAVGGSFGLLIAAWGRDLLLSMFAGASGIDLDTAFDWRVLGFSIGLTIVAGVAAGLGPAVRGTRMPLADAMKAQSRSVGVGARGALVGKALVAAQIAFCLLLLVMAALFTRSTQSLLGTDVGFEREALVVARMDPRSIGYAAAERQALYARLVERLTGLPGVVAASLSLNGPLGNSRRTSSLTVEGHTPREGEPLTTNEEIVTDAYFRTVGLRIVEGRDFSASDRDPASRSSIVNETMATRFFPGTSAIGKRWSYGGPIDAESLVIVGVVEDAKYMEVRGPVPNMAYRLSPSTPDDVLANIEVRTSAAPAQLAPTLKRALSEVEPALPVFDIVRLEARLHRGIANDRLISRLTITFSVTALLLACVGLYGTISYGVTRRMTELGVRMALGAGRKDVIWLVIREAAMLVLAGALAGLPLAYAAGRSVGSLLYGVQSLDLLSYAVAAAALTAVAGIAAFLPAHRASRIDPMTALRKD